MPGRCLRRRRRVLPGWLSGGADSRAPSSRSSTTSTPALKTRYEAFLAANDIDVAGIEFITDPEGTVYTYDVNTNTNYNPDAEARAGRSGMDTLARYLGAELARLYPGREAAE